MAAEALEGKGDDEATEGEEEVYRSLAVAAEGLEESGGDGEGQGVAEHDVKRQQAAYAI
jgi:hypothetical protein